MPANQDPNGTIDGTTVTTVVLRGTQVHRAADLVEDQLRDAVKDLSVRVAEGFCGGAPDDSRKTLNAAIARIMDLRDILDYLGYGDVEDAVLPISTLFPQFPRDEA